MAKLDANGMWEINGDNNCAGCLARVGCMSIPRVVDFMSLLSFSNALIIECDFGVFRVTQK